ncbi:ribosomal-protein-alanine acetyltransferase [Halobacteroides halobius DSM 5150]|uniref:[Ribosomal protein bS18]-alanine N-acetyltransferase n=1 Tax=Halobacteroides halobius (strain ATCC 35273 / DSM 5150 / MD-1) TaxID=748449 RepID=L0K4Y5_HALHC|nr:ribosomal protein S18-alanine N-acetyltransferase [Halobacteroides halobius]AGB40307.1 ribosomal-protein-alanine acetyltransferase [Halobacteroides halobius DSM 5150]
MDSLKIKSLEDRDLGQVLAIEEEAFSNPWSFSTFIKELHNNYAYYLVGLIEDELVGYLGCWLLCNEVHITTLAVKKEYRCQGIATQLLDELFTNVKKANYQKVSLEVRASNNRAQKLYKQAGFIKVGRKQEYYSDDQEDAIVMWKQL